MAVFEIQAGTDLQIVLTQYRAKAQAIDGLLPSIAEILVGGVLDVFEAEGPGWPDLAESTKRQRRGTTYKILQDTGMFAASIAPGWGADYAEAFAGVSYAIFHTSPEPRTKIPLRNPFNLGPFEPAILDEVAELVTSQLA